MKVVAISIPKKIYNPGDIIVVSTTVRWGLADTGGVVSILKRGEGESYWQTVGTFDIGSPGIGIPNVLMAGKNETVTVSVTAPEENGYYQLGAREQSEENVSANALVQIQVVPTTPGAETGTGVVHVSLNREAPSDLVLYVNDTPMMSLPSSGIYVTLVTGIYQLSAEGTGVKTPFSVQVTVSPGTTQEITLPLIEKTVTSDIDWNLVAVGTAAVAGVGVLAVMLSRKGD